MWYAAFKIMGTLSGKIKGANLTLLDYNETVFWYIPSKRLLSFSVQCHHIYAYNFKQNYKYAHNKTSV